MKFAILGYVCDHDINGRGCPEESNSYSTWGEARRDALAAGWKLHPTGDFCPKHAAR